MIKNAGKCVSCLTITLLLCFNALVGGYNADASEKVKSEQQAVSSKDIKVVSSDNSDKTVEVGANKESRQEPADSVVPEEVKKVLMIDLDGDGAEEKIDLKPYFSDDSGGYYKLCVSRKKGYDYVNIWESPSVKGFGEDFSFYFGDAGLEQLEMIGDIDADSNIELVSPQAQSDVRPVTFRIYRWNKRFFDIDRKGLFIAADSKNDFFEFKKEYSMEEKKVSTWIMHFNKIQKAGIVEAEIWSYVDGTVKIGEAVLAAEKTGYKVTNWLKPLKKVE